LPEGPSRQMADHPERFQKKNESVILIMILEKMCDYLS